MKRQLCVTVLFALVLVPDWASACKPNAGGPVYYVPAPVYYAPPVYCQPVYVQPCVPIMPPPRIEAVKPRPAAVLDAPRPMSQANPARPPLIETVRPAANLDVPRPAANETTIPAIAPPKSAPEPKAPAIALPKADEPRLPVLDFPMGNKEPKLPSLDLPKDTEPKLPPLVLPGVDAAPSGILPPVTGAPAIPVPAPAPDALIPPPGVSVPRTPESLPPLTLPPDTPISPDMKPTEVKSSPLTAVGRDPKVSVFPASGAAASHGLRKVGFYNHTERDVSLTIEGKAVTLPAKTYLHAQLPATFSWQYGDRPTAKETVPAEATGLDVLFRD